MKSDDFAMINCQEAQSAFSLYLDDRIEPDAGAGVDLHLESCPVCRAHFSEMNILVRDLGAVRRPTPPIGLAAEIASALRIEADARRRIPVLSIHDYLIGWIKPRLMPYSIGAFASLIFFAVMFAGLRSSLLAFQDWDTASRQAQNSVRFTEYSGYDITRPISAEIYAAGRAPFSVDSPSLNPRGALAAFTQSALQRNEDDDMIVIADVFSNGSASIADIVQAPRDPHMLVEFQAALRQNPAFVPAVFDGRPQTMRVVFSIQKVDVRERQF